MWFNNDFIGLKVHFSEPQPSTWVLQEKISENAGDCYSQEEAESYDIQMLAARAVFYCSRLDDRKPEKAVMKVFMQIPWPETEMNPIKQRSTQACPDRCEDAEIEVLALKKLTNAHCSSTPRLLATKHTRQSTSMWVPGGPLAFILMQRLPGRCIDQIEDLGPPEREEFRQSFKKAWLECHAAGVVSMDARIHNLLWDNQNRKCYIVDFGMWRQSETYGEWQDYLFIKWNLMIYVSNRKWEF